MGSPWKGSSWAVALSHLHFAISFWLWKGEQVPSPGPGTLWSTSLQTSSLPFKSLQYKTNHHVSHLTSQIGNKRLLFPGGGGGEICI